MIYVRLRDSKEPVGFYFLDMYEDEELDKKVIKKLFHMIDERLNPFECEFIDVTDDGYAEFAFIFPNQMNRVPYDEEDEELGTYWEGDFTLNDSAEEYIADDDALSEREWLNFSGKHGMEYFE